MLKRPTRDKERDMFRVLPYLRPYATQQRVAGMGFSTLPPSSGDGLTVQEAIRSVKENAKAKFDETIELALGLGLDPRKANQNLRSSVVLPHGTGKSET